jgi:methylenetetrahydrofolate reductase (NADPH)
MRIRELLTSGRPAFSFEFFPPKPENRGQLVETIVALEELRPTFISVTYGAGGSTRDLTVELVGSIKRDYGIETMAHLTCVGASRGEISLVVDRLASAGIENILALRGDPPKGQTNFQPVPDGFRYGAELAAYLRRNFHLCIAGACYPEKHPECQSFDHDLLYLRQKVEAGAEFLITQLFFDNQKYFDFVARARAMGIGVPIIPGIMPITNLAQVERITKMCGSSIPETLLSEMHRVQDHPDAVLALGVAQATAQCLELLQKGAPGIHFYTLNKSAATRMILTAIRTVWPPARFPA